MSTSKAILTVIFVLFFTFQAIADTIDNDFLFRPLIADPRWPKFSFSYRQYLTDNFVKNSLEGELGRTFSLVKSQPAQGFQLDIGIQAGALLVFDQNAPSSDFINLDCLLGLPIALKYKDTTVMARLYHRSSHLGDEFMLRGYSKKKDPDTGKGIEPAPGVDVTVNEKYVKRLNLSYETAEVIISRELLGRLRLYGGGSVVLQHNREFDTGRFGYVAGAELRLRSAVLAVNVRGLEGLDYKPSVSSATGIEVLDGIYTMFEFYTGPSQHGQFSVRDVTYFGFGLHFYR
jgi:hypothetical protein